MNLKNYLLFAQIKETHRNSFWACFLPSFYQHRIRDPVPGTVQILWEMYGQSTRGYAYGVGCEPNNYDLRCQKLCHILPNGMPYPAKKLSPTILAGESHDTLFSVAKFRSEIIIWRKHPQSAVCGYEEQSQIKNSHWVVWIPDVVNSPWTASYDY